MANPPTDWRHALGGELTAAQHLAEFALVRRATDQQLVDWLRDRAMDRARQELERWQELTREEWLRLAEQLADEAAAEVQRKGSPASWW